MTAQEIKELRIRLNLTQEQFAWKLGVTSQTISRWECGRFSPTPLALRVLLRLAKKGK